MRGMSPATTQVIAPHKTRQPWVPQRSHFYQGIPGWFDFENVYRTQVEHGRDGDYFVEIGAWMGKSTAFLAVEILNSGKDIRLDVVDTWRGSPEEMHESGQENEMHRLLRDDPELAWRAFTANTKDVSPPVHAIRMPSVEAAKQYQDRSLDFVFIDGDHAYASVMADILAWYPKVKRGGLLGGHDYGWQPLARAVHEVLGAAHDILLVHNDPATSWLVEKR